MTGESRISSQTKAFAIVALVVLVLDQVSKWAAVAALTHAFDAGSTASLGLGEKVSRFLWQRHPMRDEAVTVLPDFWHFRYVENPGAAWGFLSGSVSALRTPFFLVVSLVAMCLIIYYLQRTPREQRLTRLGLAMVFGGAVGNFFDRVRLGYVIDFIEWHWYDKAAWPTFNVADSAITVGVILLTLDMFLQKPTEDIVQNKSAVPAARR